MALADRLQAAEVFGGAFFSAIACRSRQAGGSVVAGRVATLDFDLDLTTDALVLPNDGVEPCAAGPFSIRHPPVLQYQFGSPSLVKLSLLTGVTFPAPGSRPNHAPHCAGSV